MRETSPLRSVEVHENQPRNRGKGYSLLVLIFAVVLLGASVVFLRSVFTRSSTNGVDGANEKNLQLQQIQECHTKVDFVFVLDHSGSISSSNFQLLKDFTIHIVNSFAAVGPEDVMVGYIAFSHVTYKYFDLDTFNTRSQVINKLSSISQRGGGTAIGEGMRAGASIGGQRPNTMKYMLVLSDGYNGGGVNPKTVYSTIRGTWNVLTVGVGGADVNLLRSIGREFHSVGSFSELIMNLRVELPRDCDTLCPIPSLEGSFDIGSNCGLKVASPEGTQCVFTCADGYKSTSEHNTYATCTETNGGVGAVWQYNTICVKVTECEAPAIENSSADKCGGIVEDEWCQNIVCDEGYKFDSGQDSIFIKCLESGNWASFPSPLPQCIPNPPCVKPDIPKSNAALACDKVLVGQLCEFQCDVGYEVRGGLPLLECDESTFQFKTLPTCEQSTTAGSKDITTDAQHRSNNMVNNALQKELKQAMASILFFNGQINLDDVIIPNGAVLDPYDWTGQFQNPATNGGTTPPPVDPPPAPCEDIDWCVPTDLGPACCDNVLSYEGWFQIEGLGPVCDLTNDQNVVCRDACPRTCVPECQGDKRLLQAADDVQELRYVPKEKIVRLDQQPNNNDKSVYEGYKSIVNTVLLNRPLTQSESAALTEAEGELEALEGEKEDFEASKVDGCRAVVPELYPTIANCVETRWASALQFYDDRLEKIRARINLLEYDPIVEMALRLDDDEVNTGNGETMHDWIAAPDPARVMELFETSRSSTKLSYSVSRTEVEASNDVADVEATVVGYVGGEFRTIKMSTTTIDLKVNISLGGFVPVFIRPGQWYDPTWEDYAKDNRYRRPGFDTQQIWGNSTHPGGFLSSRYTQMAVTQKASVKVSGSGSFFSEMYTLFKNNKEVKFGPICSGKACATTVNVVLDMLDPISREENHVYLREVVSTCLRASYREVSASHSIAVLGSVERLGASKTKDAMGAIFSAWKEVRATFETTDPLGSINTRYYKGAVKITEFFEQLALNTTKRDKYHPSLIWFSATDATNDCDDEDADTIAKYAHVLAQYAKEGGGLIVHGDPNIAFRWLKKVLPQMEVTTGCSVQSEEEASMTDAGRQFLPTVLSAAAISKIPCMGHFGGKQQGNLERLVMDFNNSPYIYGAFGGLLDGDSPYPIDDTLQINMQSSSTEVDDYEFTMTSDTDFPNIIGAYAPRFGA